MRILALSDAEDRALWDHYEPSRLQDVELILSCGDLPPEYLQFIVTMANCPLLYVRGNHDARYDWDPPEGCMDIDGTVYNYRGLRILGLGGSMRYKNGSDMYTESEMKARISRLWPKIALMNGFDILLSHAPAAGYGDMEDLAHRGFECFNDLIMKWSPAYMLHGHVHKEYGGGFVRERRHAAGTRIINAYGKAYLDVKEHEHPPYGKTGSYMYDLYIALKGQF